MGSEQTIIEDMKVIIAADGFPDDLSLAEADYPAAVAAALARYSKDRPDTGYQDYAGDGAAYDFTLPSDWDRSISRVENIEYPQGEQVPVHLERRDWTIYSKGTSAEKLRLLRLVPAVGETVRLFYARAHTADTSSTTVPAADLKALAHLAAGQACRILASRYAQTTEGAIGLDGVGFGSKTGDYNRLAKNEEDQYLNHMGLEDGGPPIAGGTMDTDPGLSRSRGDYLTHGSPGER